MAIRFLSNETLDGTLTVNGLLTGGSATFTSATINTGAGNVGLGVFTSSSSTTPNVRFGRNDAEYVGFKIEDRANSIVFRQDETTGNHEAIFDIWSSTSGNRAFLFKASNNAGGSSSTWLTIENSDATFVRDVSVGRNLTVTGNITGSSGTGHFSVVNASAYQLNGTYVMDSSRNLVNINQVTATEYNLPSLGMIDWANGDARIIEGEVGGYSLSFEIYNGSSALERVMLLEKDKTVSLYGDSIVGAQSVTTSTTNYEYMLRVQGKNNYSDGTTWYGTYGQILLHADTNMTGGARRFLITNALGSNKFAIVRSVDANTDPVVNSTAGGNTPNSGTADFVINNSGHIGIGVTNPQPKLHLQYAGGSYGSDTTSGFINEATSGRGTMRIRSQSNNAAELFFDIDGGIRWDISARNSGDSYNLQFYPAAATPSLTGVAAHTFELQQNGNVIVTGAGSSGMMGIGTNNPTSKLTIDNGSGAGGSLLKSSSSSYTAHFIANTGTGNAGIYCDASNGDFIGSDYIFIGQHNDKWAQISTSPAAEGIRFMPRDNIQFTIAGNGITNIYNNTAIGSSSQTEPQRLTVLKTESNGNGIWRFGTSGTTFTYTGHRFFSAITSTATSNGWYTIGNVADSCSVIIVIKTAAHSQATILASRGYGPSNVARVQILSSTKNANGGYANINAVRISGGGIIDMQLYWSSGPNVSVSVTYYGNGCDLPPDLRLSISDTGSYPYNVVDSATFRDSAASARVAGQLDIVGQTHCGSNINMYSTSKIFFHATTNANRYIGASSTNDLDIAADDDINYRTNFNRFHNGGVEYARLSDTSNSWIANGSNGKLGIGTTSPTARLYVSSFGSGTTDTVKIVHGNGSHTGNGLVLLSANTGNPFYLTGSVGSGFAEITTAYNANPNFRISGDIVAYATSDKKFKDNLNIIENPINKVQQLNGYTFDWNDKQDLYKGKDYGVVAQEVEKIMPEIVDTRFDGHKAVKYEKIVPLLIESIKELKTEIEELKKQIK